MDEPERDRRQQLALSRTDELVQLYAAKAHLNWRNYYILQFLTIGLAAVTPCLVALANENPKNGFLTWLELFFPAAAAISAGVSHIFHWREDGARYARAREALSGLLWRFQTRTAQFGPSLNEDQALDRLVTLVDQLNLQLVTEWTVEQRPAAPTPVAAAAERSAPSASQNPGPTAAF